MPGNEDSILSSTKKVLGLADNYEIFDPDIIIHINSVFSTLNQLGIGPTDGYSIEDKTAKWSDYQTSPKIIRMLKTYMNLRVKMLFDPPTTSFLIDAYNHQIQEHEHRLLYF